MVDLDNDNGEFYFRFFKNLNMMIIGLLFTILVVLQVDANGKIRNSANENTRPIIGK
jgi:hypothetical protein